MKRQAVLSLSPSVNALLHFFVFTVKARRESVHSQSLFTICFSCAPIPNMHPGQKKSSSWGSSGGAHLPQKRRKENKKERWPANAQQTLPPRTDAERRQSLFSQRSRQLRLTKPLFSPLKINGASSSPLPWLQGLTKGKRSQLLLCTAIPAFLACPWENNRRSGQQQRYSVSTEPKQKLASLARQWKALCWLTPFAQFCFVQHIHVLFSTFRSVSCCSEMWAGCPSSSLQFWQYGNNVCAKKYSPLFDTMTYTIGKRQLH